MRKISIVLFAFVIAVLSNVLPSHGQSSAKPLYLDPTQPVTARVNDLLARMSLEEKIAQMTLVEKDSIVANDIAPMGIGALLSGGGGYPKSGNNVKEWAKMVDGFQALALKSRLAIPMIYGVDAVHGHNNMVGSVIFPHNIGLGAANDPALVEQIGHATAEEMIASGIYWDYAPVVAVVQDIRWGRTFESYSENTALVSSLSSAMIRGLQGKSLNAPGSVLATAKHFIGDGGTQWGTSKTDNYKIDQGVTPADEAALREKYLPPYIEAIKNGAQSIMVSYSSWGDLKMHAQKHLITDVLKGELGFSGFVVSDWQAIDQIPGTYDDQVKIGINAGLDMIMVPYQYQRFIITIWKEVEAGDIPLTRIDDAVKRILTVKFEMGLFEHPTSDPALVASVGSDAHRAIARKAVSESAVLLQNNGGALPLAKDTATVYIAGTGADNIGFQTGGWTIDWQGKLGNTTPGTSILKAIQNTVSKKTTVTYDAQGQFDGMADVGIAVVGERPYAEGKGDQADLSLSKNDAALVASVRQHSKKLIIILLSGRPMIVGSELNQSDAFIAAFLPGTEGQGLADVLFGDQPFTGKLSFTWPRTMSQIPFDFKHLATLTGCDAPLFAFGYGLDTSSKTVLTVKDTCLKEAPPTAAPTAAATVAPNAATAAATAPSTTTTAGGAPLAPSEVQGVAMYIPFPVKVVLDGKLNDWAGVPMTTVDRGVAVSSDPAEDGPLTVALASDGTSLFVLMLSPDKNIISGQHGADYWNEDSMEFYVNQSGELTTQTYGDGIYQVNLKPLDIGKTDLAGLTITGVNADKVAVKGIVFKTANGWGFEASVPLTKAPKHGSIIGIQFQANGASTKDRDVKLIWSLADTSDKSYQDPSLFGQGIFFQVGSKAIPTPSKTGNS